MSTGRIVLPSPVEEAMPWRGPCAICDNSDARHADLNRIHDRARISRRSIPGIAADYGLSVEVVQFVAEHYSPDDETWTVPA